MLCLLIGKKNVVFIDSSHNMLFLSWLLIPLKKNWLLIEIMNCVYDISYNFYNAFVVHYFCL